MNCVSGDDLGNLRNNCQPFKPIAAEHSVRAYHFNILNAWLDKYTAYFQYRAACGDLIVIDQRPLMSLNLIAHQTADDNRLT